MRTGPLDKFETGELQTADLRFEIGRLGDRVAINIGPLGGVALKPDEAIHLANLIIDQAEIVQCLISDRRRR
jgi:hypothetical protein